MLILYAYIYACIYVCMKSNHISLLSGKSEIVPILRIKSFRNAPNKSRFYNSYFVAYQKFWILYIFIMTDNIIQEEQPNVRHKKTAFSLLYPTVGWIGIEFVSSLIFFRSLIKWFLVLRGYAILARSVNGWMTILYISRLLPAIKNHLWLSL